MVDTASRPQNIETDTWIPAEWDEYLVLLPPRNNQPVDIAVYGTPTLAVEIASTTLNDDLGRKRLLYERLGVEEYWVVNVVTSEVLAFAMRHGGSREIRTSRVLLGLELAMVEAAMQRSQTEDDSALTRWLIQTFQQ